MGTTNGGGIPPHIVEALETVPLRPELIRILVEVHLDTLIRSRGAARDVLSEAPRFIDAFRSELARRAFDPTQSARLEHAIGKAELRLAAHAIGRDHEAMATAERYRDFVSRNAGILFDSLFEWIQTLVEDDLYIAQCFHFNTLDFASVEAFLRRDLDLYEDVVRVIKQHDLDDVHTRDSLLAQMKGTLGQALAFRACMESRRETKQELFEEASGLLVQDVGMLHAGTDLWVQGVNYIVSLEWGAGRLERALRWFSESVGKPRLTERDIAVLDGANAPVLCSNAQYRWLLLNQLRLCALGQRQGVVEVSNEQLLGLLEKFSAEGSADYPNNLILKWLLFLLGDAATQSALRRCGELLAAPRDAVVLELMRAVELSLLAGKGHQDSGDLLDAAACILEEVREFGRFVELLDSSPWAAAVRKRSLEELAPYEIATALPYYYG